MPETILKSPRPWIVCDWGVIRGMTRGFRLADGFSIVLCDTLFLEAVDSDQRENMIEKLRQLLEHPGVIARVLIAFHGPQLTAFEHSPRARYKSADLIDTETTLRVRTYLRDGNRPWPQNLLSGRNSPEFDRYTRSKATFVRVCNAFADHPGHRAAVSVEAIRTGKWSMAEWIRHPDLCPQFASALDEGARYRRAAWQRELRNFPDRTAIGRLLRLFAWYAMLRVRQRDRSDAAFSNNYEDLTYAFLASYTFAMAASDRGLRDCIGAIFPKLRQYESLPGEQP